MTNNPQSTDNTALLQHIAEEQTRYNTLLKLFVSSFEQLRDEIRVLREEVKEIREEVKELRAELKDIRDEIDEIHNELAGIHVEISILKNNQIDTYQILGDMAQSISDKVLVKKINRKAANFKKALA